MSAQPKQSSQSGQQVRELKPTHLTMDASLVGKTVGFCLNKKSILPGYVIAERSPIGDEKRLDLEVTYLQREKTYEDDDDDGGPGFDPSKEQWVFMEKQKTMKNVRFYDPTVARTKDPTTGLRIIQLDNQGNQIHIPLNLFNSEPGTWFFIDRYRFRLHFHRHEVRDRANRLIRAEKNEYHPSTDGWYDTWPKCWDMIQRQAQRGKIPGTFWDEDSMEVVVEEKG